jgi:hypothetical protein
MELQEVVRGRDQGAIPSAPQPGLVDPTFSRQAG